jgi:hypothetical protein
MVTTNATIVEMGKSIGAAMWISWIVFLGPIGFLLLLGVAYAMVVQNLAVGVICGFFMFLPVVLTLVWAPLGWFAGCTNKGWPCRLMRFTDEPLVAR